MVRMLDGEKLPIRDARVWAIEKSLIATVFSPRKDVGHAAQRDEGADREDDRVDAKPADDEPLRETEGCRGERGEDDRHDETLGREHDREDTRHESDGRDRQVELTADDRDRDGQRCKADVHEPFHHRVGIPGARVPRVVERERGESRRRERHAREQQRAAKESRIATSCVPGSGRAIP